MFQCQICRSELDDDKMSRQYIGICKSCAAASKVGKLITPRDLGDWKKFAEQNSLPLFERMPQESDSEWQLWLAYSGQYPDATPNLRKAAESICMPYSTAKKISSRWEYSTRILEYKMFVDQQTKLQRAAAVREANEEHLSMAKALREKLAVAIENIDPTFLAPKDINSLLKTATELERKALLDKDTVEQVDYRPNVVDRKNQNKAKAVDKSAMAETLQILQSTGLLGKAANKIGIEQTTRVIIDNGEEEEE